LVFVQAWNAWGQAAYLEPDTYFGHAYVNATYRALTGQADLAQQRQILLVGHDAHKGGAQMLLLALARSFRERFGFDVLIALLAGGDLVDEYVRYAEVIVLDEADDDELVNCLRRRRICWAICNSVVTGQLVRELASQHLKIVSLVHEMPGLIRDLQLEAEVAAVATHADHVVFASDIVRDGFDHFVSRIQGRVRIRPQGCYKNAPASDGARDKVRSKLGLQPFASLIMGAGYADHRKGFDCFLTTAARVLAHDEEVHFLWAGALSGASSRQVKAWRQQNPFADRLHMIGFTDAIYDYYAAADTFFLPSREDPYPTVVLEAMHSGLPVVLRRGATGFDALMKTYGYCIDFDDTLALDSALYQALAENDSVRREARIRHVDEQCQFDDYTDFLICLFKNTEVIENSQISGEPLVDGLSTDEASTSTHVVAPHGVLPFTRRTVGKR